MDLLCTLTRMSSPGLKQEWLGWAYGCFTVTLFFVCLFFEFKFYTLMCLIKPSVISCHVIFCLLISVISLPPSLSTLMSIFATDDSATEGGPSPLVIGHPYTQ